MLPHTLQAYVVLAYTDIALASALQLGQEALHRQQGVDVVIGLKSRVSFLQLSTPKRKCTCLQQASRQKYRCPRKLLSLVDLPGSPRFGDRAELQER